MKRSRLYLALQAAVCVALVVLLSVSAVGIYREGSARKALDPMESVFTPEAVAGKLASVAPLFFTGIGLLIAGLVMGVRDKNDEKPAKNPEPRRNLTAARAATPSAERNGQKPADPPKRKALLQILLIGAAVLLIIAGALNGSALDVLNKAITICTECVGLG